MRFSLKSYLLLVTALGGSSVFVQDASASISANDLYIQASKGNAQYLSLIKRYNGVIDTENRNGDTAYCLALKNKDKNAIKLLEKMGADTEADCVKNAKKAKRTVKKENKKVANKRRARFRKDTDNTSYWLWGGAAVGVAGATAALSGGGGGGSSGGSSSGGSYTPPAITGDGSPKSFETQEYKKGNFLESINASKAYSHIYKTNEDGTLSSHRANDDKPLDKVKVGIFDSGVFANKELNGKVISGSDINMFNSDADMYGIDLGNVEYYIYKKEELYYPIVLRPDGYYEKGSDDALYFNELKSFFDEYNEKYGTNVDFSDFHIMNGGGNYGPGYGDSSLDDFENAAYKAAYLSHGTHIAGIIGANKDNEGMHGVAFENAKILATSWDTFSKKFENGIKYLVDDGAKVINNSWGCNEIEEDGKLKIIDMRDAEDYLLDDVDIIKSYTYSANNDVVWVQATGNEGYDQPSIYVGLPTLDLSNYAIEKEDGSFDTSFSYAGPDEDEVPMIAVTAIDPNVTSANAPKGTIADVNHCGDASGWCLAAPGIDVNSTVALPEGITSMSGTSMATPVVSGSIALLKGYYHWLSAQNIAYLLLETADNSGAYANEAIYGQGVLDLEAAVTTPIKGLGLPESADLNSVKNVGLSKIYTGSVMGNRLKKAMPKTITAYDGLKRPFQYDSSKLVDVTHSSSARLKNEVSRLAMGEAGKKVIKDEKTGFSFSSSESMNSSGNSYLTTAEVERESQNGKTRFYYAENSKYLTQDEALVNNSNPYFSMRDAYGVENTLNLSETSKLKLSLQSGENGLYERDDEMDKNSFDGRSYAMSAEYSFNLTDYLELQTLGGMLFEEDAMLGLNGIGSLGFENSSTYYMGVKAKLDLSSNVSLMAAYYRGYTSGNDSPLLSISNLETESFMVAGEYSFNPNDKIGLMFESPMEVVKGSSTFRYSTGRDSYSNTAYMNKLKTSLRPEAKEYDLGMYFKSKPNEDLSLAGKVQARFNADGEKGLVDYMGVVGAQYNF